MLTAAFCLTAAIAGFTGTWSPCGFSMVETLGIAARHGRRLLTAVSSMTFAVGAAAGCVVTFGALSELGNLLKGVGGGAATAVAVAVAAAAAVGEARGVRIVPQIRRQVPEPWRRGMPLPLAAGLYGVLLGLGFTTFVLSWAVWALAGICVALGDPALGVAIGAAFGVGRAAPIVAMAPTSFEGVGGRLLASMAERPAALRLARRADAVGLAVCAVVLVAAPAKAATVVDPHGTDPTAAGSDLAWQRPGTGGILQTGGRQIVLPGDIPAIGGPNIAWRNGSRVTVANRATLQPFVQFDAAGVNALAVSGTWVAFRRSDGRHDSLEARPLASPANVRPVTSASFPNQIGRPSLDGTHLLFTFARGTSTAIVADDLGKRRRRTVRKGSSTQYLNPSRLGGRLLYVTITRCRQQLRIVRPKGERVLMTLPPMAAQDVGFEPGHTSQGSRKPCPGGATPPGQRLLWTTALSPTAALVTELHTSSSGALIPSLLSVRR